MNKKRKALHRRLFLAHRLNANYLRLKNQSVSKVLETKKWGFVMKLLILTAALLLSVQSQAQILQNLQTAAAIDIVGPFNFEDSAENKLDIRSAEMTLFGPLDPTFDATLTFAAHNEHGEFTPEVHEAFLSSSKLIPSSRIKAGKFFLGVGRLNQFHTHDWAFVSAPRVQHEFFGDEGVTDTGVEYSVLLPTDSYWDITLGVTNGYSFGHSHDPEEKPHVPTHYIHPVNFVDFGDKGALQWGMNYLGRTDAAGINTQMYGLDFVFKKTTAKTLDFLFQSEIWYRNQNSDETARTEDVGAYLFPQTSLSERLYAGVRVDLYTELARNDENGEAQDNFNYALVPTLTYKNSEFTTFRLAYTYDVQTYQGQSDQVNQMIEVQLIAILGAHPAHAF